MAIITLPSPSIRPLALVALVAATDPVALALALAAVLEAPLADADDEALRRDPKLGSWTGGFAALQIPWAVVSVAFWSAAEQFALMQGATVARNWFATQKQWTWMRC
jgi:hypothetical protein